MKDGKTTEEIKIIVDSLDENTVIITDEIGNGIIPVDQFERDWREQTGRICCYIASQSRKSCKINRGYTCNNKRTKVNENNFYTSWANKKAMKKKRYIGRTDESLSQKGIEEIKNRLYPGVDTVLVSPMKKMCRDCKKIIYPDSKYIICNDFRECDFWYL